MLNDVYAAINHYKKVLELDPNHLEAASSLERLYQMTEQYEALVKEFNAAAHGLWKAATDEERATAAARGYEVTPRLLALAEKYPREPFVLDALVQVVVQVNWLENNTLHPGLGKDSPSARAIAILIRDHIKSDKFSHATWRVQYGFRKENETLLRAAFEKSPHKEIQAMACLRLGQFLLARLHRVDILRDKPEMARRYEGLFGKDYLEALRRQDRAEATREIETLLERAARDFGDVKVPYEDTVAEAARSELHEIRHLSVGNPAQEIDGEDQDGRRFKLSDYRGKVVLLYFWSEY